MRRNARIECRTMSRVQRWNEILDRLAESGEIEVIDVATDLEVSPSTIRRDLQQLESQGLLSRTHGGAMPVGSFHELPLRYRGERRHEEKKRIAKEATKKVTENLVVGLTGGTTTTEIARAIAETHGLTIVTNAINIAAELTIRPNLKLVVTGGVARSRSYELAGPIAEETLRDLNLDLLFAGVDGISVEKGLTTHHETEARTNMAMISSAAHVVVVTDSSKLGKVTFSAICGISKIDELITDTDADPEQVEKLREAGVTVTTV